MNIDWLIVGGGIHGVHIAARLIGEGGVSPDRVRIVDPAKRLLDRWRVCTARTGMSYLRSPTVHHLDLEPWSLRDFAGKRKRRAPGLFAPPYDRPSLALFNTHCERVIERFGLQKLHLRERVTACDVQRAGVRAHVTDGRELFAQHAVLAIGASEQPFWPRWAPRNHPRVHHVFEPSFDGWPSEPENIAVIGGGISAGQVAMRLAREGHRVQLIARHALRQHQFDSDPGWLGPRHMTTFNRERSPDRRRAMIVGARRRGSVPPGLRRALRRAFREGQVSWHEAEVTQIVAGTETARLHLAGRGFSRSAAAPPLIDELVVRKTQREATREKTTAC